MRKLLLLYIVAAALASATPAQTPTVVTGTVKDVNGVVYNFAKVSAQLIPTTASPTIIVNGIPVQIGGQQNANADANGTFSMNLFCNTAGGGCSVISPSGTQWQITVNTNGVALPVGTGPQACTATVTITGSAQSLSANFASCPALIATGVGGGGCATCLVNQVPVSNGSNGLLPSSLTDNTTTVSTPEPIVTTSSVSTGTSPPTCTPGTAGGACMTVGTAPTPAASVVTYHADGTQLAFMVNNNNTGEMATSRAACVNVTPVTVNANVTTDQTLMSCTLSANLLNVTGRTLKLWAAGVYSTAAASTAQMTLKAKLCTTSSACGATVIIPVSIQTTALGTVTITNDPWNFTSYLTTQTAGAASAYESHGLLSMDLAAAATAAESVFNDTSTATVGTIDSTGQLFLVVTGAFSAASASNSMTERQLIVEVVN